MPIIDIELVGDAESSPSLPRRLADAIGGALGASPGGTWVKLHHLASSDYGESGTDDPVEPVFVTIMQRRRPEPATLAEAVAAVTDAVSKVTGRPRQHVHVLFAESGAGRAAFGGSVVS